MMAASKADLMAAKMVEMMVEPLVKSMVVQRAPKLAD